MSVFSWLTWEWIRIEDASPWCTSGLCVRCSVRPGPAGARRTSLQWRRKLSRVGVATAQQLAELLAEINSRLLKAGQKAFNSETLAALRSRLEAKGDGRETKDEPKATGYPGQREASATAPTAAPGQGQGATAKSTATANLPQHERREAAPDQKPAPEAKDPPGPVPSTYSPSTYSPSAQFGTLEALGETQLIKAVRQNDLRTAQYLLEHRADPNEKDDGFGETALMEAAAQGQPNLCKLLLESLANVGYRSPTKLRAQDLAADHVKHFFNMPQSYWHDRGLRLAARQHNLRRAALLLERAKQDKQERSM
ncbi:unnamed protein product [Effrenium voratum]|nr:unnamed protein product [Effrenium voratum]